MLLNILQIAPKTVLLLFNPPALLSTAGKNLLQNSSSQWQIASDFESLSSQATMGRLHQQGFA
jgi:hypothetical protein